MSGNVIQLAEYRERLVRKKRAEAWSKLSDRLLRADVYLPTDPVIGWDFARGESRTMLVYFDEVGVIAQTAWDELSRFPTR